MSLDEMAALAAEGERRGLRGVFVTEAWRSGLVFLAVIAARTTMIEIGPYVLNAYATSPFITGLSAIDLDEASGGRLVLGIGAGNRFTNEHYQGISHERPLEKMRDYVDILHAMVAARPGSFLHRAGTIHSIDGWPPQVRPVRASIPIVLAAQSPKMTQLAAEIADGIAMGSLLSVDFITADVEDQTEAA